VAGETRTTVKRLLGWGWLGGLERACGIDRRRRAAGAAPSSIAGAPLRVAIISTNPPIHQSDKRRFDADQSYNLKQASNETLIDSEF
jgi:hypothetical protein